MDRVFEVLHVPHPGLLSYSATQVAKLFIRNRRTGAELEGLPVLARRVTLSE